MGLRKPDVSRPPHATGGRRLGHRPFHSGTLGIGGFKGSSVLALSGLQQGVMRHARMQGQLPSTKLAAGAARTDGAPATVGLAKLDLDGCKSQYLI